MGETLPLSINDREVLNFVEQYYLIHGSMPEVNEVSASVLLPESVIITIMQTKHVKEALLARGVVLASPGNRLSPEQLACANLLLDFTDGRSEKKKLGDLGISTTQYQGWLRNPAFKEYVRRRAEDMLGDNMHTAHTALIDSVRGGDVPALKLYYEMTGRHSSKTVGEMNIQYFMAKVLETIQRHVSPDQMREIAAEFDVLSQIQQPKELVYEHPNNAA